MNQPTPRNLVKPENLGAYATLFATVSFPHKTPDSDTWQRCNGRDLLVVKAGERPKIKNRKYVTDIQGNVVMEKLQIPSGLVPRQIMIHLSQQYRFALERGENPRKILLGHCLHEFLENIGYSTMGGEQYTRVLDQINRLFYCQIRYVQLDEQGVLDQAVPRMTEQVRIWWEDVKEDQLTMLPSYVIISETLAGILSKIMPIDLDVVRQISSCLVFDTLMWLSHKLFYLPHRQFISFEDLQFQLGSNYKRARVFREKFGEAFKRVSEIYQQNCTLTEKGIWLVPSKPFVDPKTGSWKKARFALEKQARGSHE